MYRSVLALLFVVSVSASWALPAGADEAASSQRAARLAGQIESPFCPGKTLNSCSSPAAAVWRADIREWVEEGVDSNQIKARLSSRAQRDLRLIPEQNTFSPLLFIGAFAGLFGLALVVRLRKTSAGESEQDSLADVAEASERSAAEAPRDEFDARLDDELALYDS